MEKTKANKGLKIVAIVLNVIVVIIVGIACFNMSFPKECSDNVMTGNLSEMQIKIFNQKFITYEGTRAGSQIKTLVSIVNASNASEDNLVTMNNDKSYQYKFKGGSAKKYKVEIEKKEKNVSNINIYDYITPENTNDNTINNELSNCIVGIESDIDFENKIKEKELKEKELKETQQINNTKKFDLLDFIKNIAIVIIFTSIPYLIIFIVFRNEKKYNKTKYKDDELIVKNNKTQKIELILYIIFAFITLLFWGYIILKVNEPIKVNEPTQLVAKPIIYIYPTEETSVTVELGNKELLTCTYPIYKDKWEVLAKPDGTLIDEKTGKSYYALYWEGKNSKNYFGKLEEGFVVKGEDTISFLEEKLEILGLNEREAEEFIVYWLPKMQNNKYNYIRFQTEEEIEKNMPLNVSPKPETVIRVMMEWKGLNNPIEVKEQVLEKKVRSGYTIVEWGGTEIK